MIALVLVVLVVLLLLVGVWFAGLFLRGMAS